VGNPWIIDPETRAVGPWWDFEVESGLQRRRTVGVVTNGVRADPVLHRGGEKLGQPFGVRTPPGVVTSHLAVRRPLQATLIRNGRVLIAIYAGLSHTLTWFNMVNCGSGATVHRRGMSIEPEAVLGQSRG